MTLDSSVRWYIPDIRKEELEKYRLRVIPFFYKNKVGDEIKKIRNQYRFSILEVSILEIVEDALALSLNIWELLRYETQKENSQLLPRKLTMAEITLAKLYSLHIGVSYAALMLKKLYGNLQGHIIPNIINGFPKKFFDDFNIELNELISLILFQFVNMLNQDKMSQDPLFRVQDEGTFLRFALSFFEMLGRTIIKELGETETTALLPLISKLSFLIHDVAVSGLNVSFSFRKKQDNGITFEDIGGNKEAKKEFMEVAAAFKNQDIYERWGSRPPKGVLLVGPPGCGKTLLARAFANEVGLPITIINVDDVVSSFYGQSALNIARLLDNQGIIFIDEIDSLGRKRTERTDEETVRIVNVLNQKLAGFKAQEEDKRFKQIFIAATNRIQDMDPALLRSGRFDRILYLSYPDKETILEIFKVHKRKIEIRAKRKIFAELDYKLIVSNMHEKQMSGADIEEILRRVTARKAQEEITMKQNISRKCECNKNYKNNKDEIKNKSNNNNNNNEDNEENENNKGSNDNESTELILLDFITTEDILAQINSFERDAGIQAMREEFMEKTSPLLGLTLDGLIQAISLGKDSATAKNVNAENTNKERTFL